MSNISTLRIQRKLGESLMIGHEIEVIFEKSDRNGMVSCVIKAPRSVPIHRTEVYYRRYPKSPPQEI